MNLQQSCLVDLFINPEVSIEFVEEGLDNFGISDHNRHQYRGEAWTCCIDLAHEDKRVNQDVKNLLVIDKIRADYIVDWLTLELLCECVMVALITPSELEWNHISRTVVQLVTLHDQGHYFLEICGEWP